MMANLMATDKSKVSKILKKKFGIVIPLPLNSWKTQSLT
jgi:hypothetical protein